MPSLDSRNADLSFTAFWKLNLYLSIKTETKQNVCVENVNMEMFIILGTCQLSEN